MLDIPCSEVAWRVLATHSIRQVPLHFPSRASPCAITFQLGSNTEVVLKAYWTRTHNTATFNRQHIDSNQLLPTDRHHRTIHTGASDVASNTERERIKPMVKRKKNQIKRTVKKIWFPLFDSLFVIQVNSMCYRAFGRTKKRWQYESKEMNVL